MLKRWLGNAYQGKFTTLHREAVLLAAQGAAQNFGTVADALEQTFVGYMLRVQIDTSRQAIAREIAVASSREKAAGR